MDIMITANDSGEPMTTSRNVAEVFGKRHADILRAIENLECSVSFNQRNFALVKYLDVKGEQRKQYNITKDGFVFLAGRFTGKKAAAFQEAYINRFNEMEQALKDMAAQKPAVDHMVSDLRGIASMSRELRQTQGRAAAGMFLNNMLSQLGLDDVVPTAHGDMDDGEACIDYLLKWGGGIHTIMRGPHGMWVPVKCADIDAFFASTPWGRCWRRVLGELPYVSTVRKSNRMARGRTHMYIPYERS